ncbi:MAG: DUF4190 domain-containing protein [Propionibacteriaceae bacterium]|nr:DUF4190 domain-containing protein [Propionibacteriaceae bacterium]
MSGQHESDPQNRFETWADGMTPAGQQPPSSSPSANDLPDAVSAPEPEPEPLPETPGPSFPTYPYPGSASSYADPQQDEAYAAFQGYRASTQGYPGQSMQPYQAYQGPYSSPHGPYGRQVPNAPYAVPSLVLGAISLFSCGLTGPIGLGLGIAAVRQIDAAQQALGGRGMAIAGIATSALGTLFLLLMILGVLS